MNISPDYYKYDDVEFPRLTGNSIGVGNATYGSKGNSWIKMHSITDKFKIFGDSIKATDIKQGSLGNCYSLAAYASLANIRNGTMIKDIFITKEDNQKHVYITRWFILGKIRYVAVDDWVPTNDNKRASFSNPIGDNDYWAVILEKAWAKIHGNYLRTESGISGEVVEALTSAPYQAKLVTESYPSFELIKSYL